MAEFKTAYLQREVPLDLVVVVPAGQKLKVGDLVTVTPETDAVSAYMQKATSLATATHIVAQSDMTLGYGHVPVENRDYRYNPEVEGTATAVPTDKTGVWKHVALYLIVDKNDIIPAADGSDHT